jgi:hypothetical protein
LLNWRPVVPLTTGIARTVEALRAQLRESGEAVP